MVRWTHLFLLFDSLSGRFVFSERPIWHFLHFVDCLPICSCCRISGSAGSFFLHSLVIQMNFLLVIDLLVTSLNIEELHKSDPSSECIFCQRRNSILVFCCVLEEGWFLFAFLADCYSVTVGEYNILVNFPLINGLGVVFFLKSDILSDPSMSFYLTISCAI
jgi:hypothetical protein